LKIRGRAYAWICAAGLRASAALAADPADATLLATETADRIELTVPVSRLILSFPKGSLAAVAGERTGAQAHPRYFHYADANSGLVVSGWIESSDAFEGFRKFWIGELAAMKKSGMPPTTPPVAVEAGEWIGIAYEIALPGTTDVTNTHIRAELLRAGTWADLHISLTTAESVPVAREKLARFLKSITVREKGAATSQDTPAPQPAAR
jgi:hypothetical protein